MNHNEEVPDFLGGHGDLLPADVLKKVNELLEQLHQKDKDHQGSPVFIYAPGSLILEPTPDPSQKGREQMALKRQRACLMFSPPTRRWRCGGRHSGRATWMSTTSPCSRGRRRHCWLTIWQRSWKSKINGRPSRCYGIEETCTAIITMP